MSRTAAGINHIEFCEFRRPDFETTSGRLPDGSQTVSVWYSFFFFKSRAGRSGYSLIRTRAGRSDYLLICSKSSTDIPVCVLCFFSSEPIVSNKPHPAEIDSKSAPQCAPQEVYKAELRKNPVGISNWRHGYLCRLTPCFLMSGTSAYFMAIFR